MRSRKWKHKEGRRTSHSYWSWTHGPRWTTHGTSGRRPWGWMDSRRWYREEIGKKTLILGVSSARAIYWRRGASRGSTKEPNAPWRVQPLGRAIMAPGSLVVALWPHPGVSRRFRRAGFSGIFGA